MIIEKTDEIKPNTAAYIKNGRWTVRKNHVKCEVTLIPIYLNLAQINDK